MSGGGTLKGRALASRKQGGQFPRGQRYHASGDGASGHWHGVRGWACAGGACWAGRAGLAVEAVVEAVPAGEYRGQLSRGGRYHIEARQKSYNVL